MGELRKVAAEPAVEPNLAFLGVHGDALHPGHQSARPMLRPAHSPPIASVTEPTA